MGGLVVLVAVVAALVDAVRRSDAVSAVFLVLLGPVGLRIYFARRRSRTAAM